MNTEPTMRQVVHRICEAWTTLSLADWQTLASPDVVYQNMPWPDVTTTGPDAVFQSLQPFISTYHVSTNVLLTVESGPDIVVERIETLRHKHNPALECSLDVLGVFRFSGGKLVQWRDYFDGRDFVNLLRQGDGSSQVEN